MPMMGVYAITNKINGRRYIGASTDVERRWRYHISARSSGLIHRELRYYGIPAFDFEILEHVDDPAVLAEAERSWLRMLPIGSLYNHRIAAGGVRRIARALGVSMDDIVLPRTESPDADDR